MFSYSVKSILISMIFVLTFENVITLVNSYVLPEPTFKILQPQGIQISIPDEPGIQFFAFQGNINKRIQVTQSGQISGEVFRKNDGKWTIEDEDISLRDGDVIHYWIHVLVNGTPYQKGNIKWTVTSETQESPSTEKPNDSSSTLLFEDNFDSLNTSIWSHDVKMPLSPDYEFCVYHNDQHDFLTVIEDGVLRIKPVVLEDLYGENATAFGTLQLSGCTSIFPKECMRQAVAFNILPPLISARLTTKNSFYFRYGKIEIRAKFPEGDWLYPEMWLEPKYNNYGPGYSSGRVILGLARGNDNLINVANNDVFDSRRLDLGIMAGTTNHIAKHMISKIREDGERWTKEFHVYTTIWNNDGFQFLVDGENVGTLSPGMNGWEQVNDVNKIAPFDQEFYISIGVGVGGIRFFPDGTTNAGNAKPWSNSAAKAMLQFWRARNQWLPSLKRENGKMATFQIDYIRVWSS
nr:PREDICTED: beta-1,3-glucan-binding protein-like [Megachile rotundata]